MIHFVVPAAHVAMMREYLDLWGKDVADRLRITPCESLPGATTIAAGTYVLAALDQHSPAMAAFILAFHDALVSRHDVRFLNHPTRTLQRFALLNELHSLGRNSFRAVRVSGELGALRYPVFVRSETTHDGALSPLVHTPAELEAAVGRALVHGYSAKSLLIVEFCDTADADGYYRKYSAFVVGGHVVQRSLSYSRTWMLKFQGSEFSSRMAQEEQDYVLGNPHESELRELFSIAHVDYGRMDYAVKDGRIQTWEINLNPTIGRGLRASTGKVPPDVAAIRVPTKEHFYRRFREAWDSVNLTVPGDAPLPLTIDERIVRSALADRGANGGWLEQLRRVLRPMKPIIEPVMTRALPALGRVAMRRSRT
jgi:hypothetical protein